MLIHEPMLAVQGFRPELAVYPYLATPKIDGIRAYTDTGHVWSRSGQSPANLWLCCELPRILPEGVDFEFAVGNLGESDVFNQTYRFFSTIGAEPVAGQSLSLYLFDYVLDHRRRYDERVAALWTIKDRLIEAGWVRCRGEKGQPTFTHPRIPITIRFLLPVWVFDVHGLHDLYETYLASGYEGIMLRRDSAPYKFGRSTLSEHGLIKYKPSMEGTARIISMEPLMTNMNEATVDAYGKTKRSTHQAGMVASDTLGRFFVRDCDSEKTFYVGGGPGLTSAKRLEFWHRREELVGHIIEYRHTPYGAVDKPRSPQFLCIKDERAY